ncbi:enoyl-CoA hydratase-related protein [Aestuariivirga sp.]|jgi:crotonobetainyl-CoA hydratase|uniref:enoyl-CoA hydratase-related protein n=1 Tax=Aestuariivirga sp. TaxID=2650926 RepID=UPI0037844D17
MDHHRNEHLKIQAEDGVLMITLDRPPANAIDMKVSRDLGDILLSFRDDPALHAVIFTGSGTRFFCPGWDLKSDYGEDRTRVNYGVGGFGGFQELPHLNKPVIFGINGICCGGGLEIALCGDILVAAEHATFSLPEVRIGTHAPAACIALAKRIPYHIAMEMLLTGRWFDAREAHRWGLVNHVVPSEALLAKCWEIARTITGRSPEVYAVAKEIVRESEDMKRRDALNKLKARQFRSVAAEIAKCSKTN